MNPRLVKSVDLIADLTKQLITLSTGIVTITLLFSKDIFGPRQIAVWAWTFYLFSTVFGLWALMALTGTLLGKPTDAPADVDFPIKLNVRIPSGLQILSFGVAIIFTMIYVFRAFAGPAPPAQPPYPPPTVINVPCPCLTGAQRSEKGPETPNKNDKTTKSDKHLSHVPHK
jgi:hypothetical protein